MPSIPGKPYAVYAIWSPVRKEYLHSLADPAVFKRLSDAKHVLSLQKPKYKSQIVKLSAR